MSVMGCRAAARISADEGRHQGDDVEVGERFPEPHRTGQKLPQPEPTGGGGHGDEADPHEFQPIEGMPVIGFVVIVVVFSVAWIVCVFGPICDSPACW